MLYLSTYRKKDGRFGARPSSFLSDIDIKKYRHELSGATYDFNMDYDVDIKPIAKNQEHFNKWVEVYPFYSNVASEGVKLFDAA